MCLNVDIELLGKSSDEFILDNFLGFVDVVVVVVVVVVKTSQ